MAKTSTNISLDPELKRSSQELLQTSALICPRRSPSS